MNKRSGRMLMVVALFAAAYGTTALGQPEMVTVHLSATPQNAGKIAQATLVPQERGTAIRLLISGVPNSSALPPRIHTFIYTGTCGNLGAKPAYTLDRGVLGDRVRSGLPTNDMSMSKVIPASMNLLMSSDYAVVVRTGPADGNVAIFCGNLTRTS